MERTTRRERLELVSATLCALPSRAEAHLGMQLLHEERDPKEDSKRLNWVVSKREAAEARSGENGALLPTARSQGFSQMQEARRGDILAATQMSTVLISSLFERRSSLRWLGVSCDSFKPSGLS